MGEFFTLTDPDCTLAPVMAGQGPCIIRYLSSSNTWTGGESNMQYKTVPVYIRQDETDITQYSFLIKTENVGTLDLQICCENVQELTTCVNYVAEVTEPTDCEPNVQPGSISDTFVQEVNGEATPQLLFSKSNTYSLTGSYTPPTTEAACDSPTITMKIGDIICCTSSSDPVFWDSSALGVYYST